MDEKERKKIIQEARRYGSISLRRQKLRVHKNGAKFPISKAYVDDELLDPGISYTLILIPEAKIAEKTSIALTFFKRKSGPHLFYSYPEDALNNIEKESLIEVMTQSFKERFFPYQSSTISSINYYFEIPSEWARGNKEMLLISVFLDQKITDAIKEVIKYLCIDFESQLRSNPYAFKALYVYEMDSVPKEEHANITDSYNDLKESLQEFYKKIKVLQRWKNANHVITVSMEIENKLDLNYIAQNIEGAEFNTERFPGLVMKSDTPNVTIILFSSGKMVITGLKKASEAEQLVDNAINKIRNVGAKITSRKITFESAK
ncbi:MAG: hypothetical protein ACFE96_15535 [Candidatus Hermodarchaeota archaeon]